MKRTVNIKGIDFEVEFEYSPEERMVMYYPDGSGYPGCPAQVDEISEIKYNGEDFYEFFEDNLSIVEKAILDLMEDEL